MFTRLSQRLRIITAALQVILSAYRSRASSPTSPSVPPKLYSGPSSDTYDAQPFRLQTMGGIGVTLFCLTATPRTIFTIPYTAGHRMTIQARIFVTMAGSDGIVVTLPSLPASMEGDMSICAVRNGANPEYQINYGTPPAIATVFLAGGSYSGYIDVTLNLGNGAADGTITIALTAQNPSTATVASNSYALVSQTNG